MDKEITQKTVIALLLLTILISVLGTFAVLKATESYKETSKKFITVAEETEDLKADSGAAVTLAVIEPQNNPYNKQS